MYPWVRSLMAGVASASGIATDGFAAERRGSESESEL